MFNQFSTMTAPSKRCSDRHFVRQLHKVEAMAIYDVFHYDWHATLLRVFGLDYTKLVYKRNGVNASLVDGQEAHVVKELLA